MEGPDFYYSTQVPKTRRSSVVSAEEYNSIFDPVAMTSLLVGFCAAVCGF